MHINLLQSLSHLTLPLLLFWDLPFKIWFLLFSILTYSPSYSPSLFSSLLDPLSLWVPLFLTNPYFPGSNPSFIFICFSKHLTFDSLPFILFLFFSLIVHLFPQQSSHLCSPQRHLLYLPTCFFPPSLPGSVSYSLHPTGLIFYSALPVAAGKAQRQREVIKLEMLSWSPKMPVCSALPLGHSLVMAWLLGQDSSVSQLCCHTAFSDNGTQAQCLKGSKRLLYSSPWSIWLNDQDRSPAQNKLVP